MHPTPQQIGAVPEPNPPPIPNDTLVWDGSAWAASPPSITVQDEGLGITNTPHKIFNFVGSGVTAVDGGSGVATITVLPSTNAPFILNQIISPVIVGDQDDWSPAGLPTANVIRMDTAANIDITGIVAQPSGATYLVISVGAGNVKFKNESALSVAANRFAIRADQTVESNEMTLIWYDIASERWRLLRI